MNVFKWLLVVSGLVLVVCGLQLVQMQRAIDAWQAEVTRLESEITRLELQAESDFYWGVTTSCTYIGLQMQAPREMVVVQCASMMKSAYEGDWYNEMKTDSRVWPPKKE